MKRLAVLGILVLICGQWGCSALPQAGSLERMDLDAGRAAAKACVRDYQNRYPNVPAFDAWNGCWRAHGKVGAPPQRVQG